MTYLAVDKDGIEKITNVRFFKAEEALNILIEEEQKYEMYRDKCVNVWTDDYSDGYFNVPKFSGVILPKGTIKKLIGFELTWDDNPYKIE